MSIYPRGGATPDEIGLPNPPANITESADCQLRGYGPGCGQPVDADSLNQMIWSLAWVAFRAGCTPRCGTTESDVSWLADAIEKMVCSGVVMCDVADPVANGSTSTTTTTIDANGNTIECTTTTPGDGCPPFHVNTTTGCLFYYCSATGGYTSILNGYFHVGPCSDGTDGRVPDCALFWYQLDLQRLVIRCGDDWLSTSGGGGDGGSALCLSNDAGNVAQIRNGCLFVPGGGGGGALDCSDVEACLSALLCGNNLPIITTISKGIEKTSASQLNDPVPANAYALACQGGNLGRICYRFFNFFDDGTIDDGFNGGDTDN